MRVNDLDDLEAVNPNIWDSKEGFYLFPDDETIAVNKNGIMFNTLTGNEIKPSLNSNKRPTIAVRRSDGSRRCYLHHRIIARTFIGRPSRHLDKLFDSLQVNHVDGDILNFQCSNLEWVTPKENIDHAHDILKYARDQPVIAKSLTTGIETRFRSRSACAGCFNVIRPTFYTHLANGHSGKAHAGNHIFKYDDGSDWVTYPKQEMYFLGKGISKEVVVTDNDSGRMILFSTLKEAADYLKVNYQKLYKLLRRQGDALLESKSVRFRS